MQQDLDLQLSKHLIIGSVALKKRHDIRVRVMQGEASSADAVNIHIAHELLPKLIRGVSGHDVYNTDETGVNYCAKLLHATVFAISSASANSHIYFQQ
jgi:hypothetical protein